MKVHCLQQWQESLTPSGSGRLVTEGDITSAQSQAVGEGQLFFLEGNQEGYGDMTWRAGGEVVKSHGE